MEPLDVLKKALQTHSIQKYGTTIKLHEALSEQEIGDLKRRLPNKLPGEIRKLLAFTSGFEFPPFGLVDFCGRLPFQFKEAFPFGLPVANDDAGNFWIQDIRSDTGIWGQVFFVCHDPPVIAIQAQTLVEFLEKIFDLKNVRSRGHLKQTIEVGVDRIWASDSSSMSFEEAAMSHDPILAACAKQLDQAFTFVDLRTSEIGSGFVYGSPGSIVRRCGADPVFAVKNARPRNA
jgi:hypothetical protein